MLCVRVPVSLSRAVKVYAATRGISVQDLIIALLTKRVSRTIKGAGSHE
jgi:predicted HicB family RNase H-like nuclease